MGASVVVDYRLNMVVYVNHFFEIDNNRTTATGSSARRTVRQYSSNEFMTRSGSIIVILCVVE
jgi:hypothetical protein